jgi:thiamine monophosphate kinase
MALALSGGEDYELVLAIPAERWPALRADWSRQFALPLTAVGRFTDRPESGAPVQVRGYDATTLGYDHFAAEPA